MNATPFAVILVAGVSVGLCACGGNSTDSTNAGRPESDLTVLQTRLAALEQRRARVEDVKDIERLQRAYGYYIDQALWDQAADLFANDATIEIGLDGVYVGKDRIRRYLYALGGGRTGLREGQLNEHLQLMPVITVAPDGESAKGRWRGLIMAGRLGGEDAVWGEGPYENEYVKEDGVWKIEKLHWYQSMLVPYDGGWQTNEDVNGGKWVSDALPPDRPPSVEYGTWPDTYLPPFHFPNPVADASERPAADGAPQAPAEQASFDTLAARAATLSAQVRLLEDQNEIEKLQRIYGFYTDKQMWSQAADLFADDGTIEVGGSGVYVGKDRVLAYLKHLGPEFPQEGRLNDRMQLQGIVHVAPDGRTARGRWHLFAQEAVWGEYARWGLGVYENEYVKQEGVWKIARLHVYNRMFTPYEDGWGKTAIPNSGPAADLPPDLPPSVDYAAYPAVFVVPFHYENPVTGGPVYAGTAADHAPAPAADDTSLERMLADLEHELGLLEDREQIARLNAIYGYYLARNQWDDLAGIFAPDGSIEIAMRGVYDGRDNVRRNLNLYGKAGIQHGLLHNHMQYQRVIDVADDGTTAKMRSRAFSIMGQYGAYSMWMGGIYENEFVKIDGVWQIKWDQQLNTYFVPYTVGWKDVPPRPPPGISETNPPDRPPTTSFEMYPHAFLPPYHYPNPVTGRTVSWPAKQP
jgi:hypothetical protein